MTNTATSAVTPDTIALSSRPSLAVYDGQIRLGHLVRRGDGFEAFDVDGVSYGTFHDMKSAAFILPARTAP
jgi:hypothetical protein